jgi:heme-degrading monooxygenase HmoA
VADLYIGREKLPACWLLSGVRDLPGNRIEWEDSKMAATYEVRFQTVPPEKREEYVKMYKQAIQEIKLSGCKSGLIFCSEDDPESVVVLLEWESKEHHQRWRGTPPHTRFRRAVEGWQSKPSSGGYYFAETI